MPMVHARRVETIPPPISIARKLIDAWLAVVELVAAVSAKKSRMSRALAPGIGEPLRDSCGPHGEAGRR